MPATTATGGPPDDDLLQLVAEPFESIEGTYDRLHAEFEAVERPGPPLGEFEREFRAQLRC